MKYTTYEQDGKWYVANSKKTRFWRDTESNTEAEAKVKAKEKLEKYYVDQVQSHYYKAVVYFSKLEKLNPSKYDECLHDGEPKTNFGDLVC